MLLEIDKVLKIVPMNRTNMFFNPFKFCIFLLLSIMLFGCGKKSLKYTDIVNRMTDMERLALLPEIGETSGMFSSYDRKSEFDETTNQFINWSANNDGLSPQYIRKEGENMVLAEMEGPGAIVRIWSASPKQGHVKVYIDGNEQPIIDLPFIDFFNTEKFKPFSFPNLVYETNAKGFNNYVPITFQKSIKIVGEPNWGQYYHFNYITFPKTTSVESFTKELNEASFNALEKIDSIMDNDLGDAFTYEDNTTEEISLTIAPGETKTIFHIEGNHAINKFQVQLKDIPDEQLNEVYRKTVLVARWDGQNEPSIWSPVGDFFGSAPGYNEYSTLPMGMEKDGWMYSNWYMPFAKSANMSLENHSDRSIQVKARITHKKLNGNPKEYGHFHAKWHRDLDSVSKEQWPDWTVLKTKGRGRFVGMFLSVWNPKGGSCKAFGGEGQHWWGEGDEKFFVDGETFPSTFGTGTEDYFGYAWCIPNYFQQAYHSQNFTQGNMGYQSLNRWQIIDNVPFQSSFDGYLEKYFPNEWPTQYACVAYWYLNSEGEDPLGSIPEGQLYGFEEQYKVFREDHVVEGEDLKVTSNSGGWHSTDVFSDETLFDVVSGHKMLLWFGKEDDESVMEIEAGVLEPGSYSIWAHTVNFKDGGRFSVAVNGKELAEQINCKIKNDQPTALQKLGAIQIDKKDIHLTIKWSQEKDGKRLGLDYLKFQREK